MRAYSSMPTSEFVEQLRDIAINAGARSQVIDQLDQIVDAPNEDEIEARCDEAYDKGEQDGRAEWFQRLENAHAELADLDLADEHYRLVSAIIKNIDPVS